MESEVFSQTWILGSISFQCMWISLAEDKIINEIDSLV